MAVRGKKGRRIREKRTPTCRRAVRARRDGRNDGRGDPRVGGCTPPPRVMAKGWKVAAAVHIEWALARARHGHPLYQRPWHFATSHRIMKQHVGLRLYWRQGPCFASRRIVYCAARRPPQSPSAPIVLLGLSCTIFALVLRRLMLSR